MVARREKDEDEEEARAHVVSGMLKFYDVSTGLFGIRYSDGNRYTAVRCAIRDCVGGLHACADASEVQGARGISWLGRKQKSITIRTTTTLLLLLQDPNLLHARTTIY